MRSMLMLSAVMVAGCAKGTPGTLAAPQAAELVVQSFMKAVADSNLAMLGELWGTDKGSAAATGVPADWPKRVTIMHAYLKGGKTRLLGSAPGYGDENHRQLLVELSREGCSKQVPFKVVKTKDGKWLVNDVDLNAAGVPGRTCGDDKSLSNVKAKDKDKDK